MGIGTILVGLALFVLVVTLVIHPLLDHKSPAIEPLEPEDELENEREATIRSIRELDLDFRTHKLSEQDYRRLREELVQNGTRILRELDTLKQQSPVADTIDAEIEARVAALVKAGAKVVLRFCPSCGTAVKPDDMFCAHCGYSLASAGASQRAHNP